MLKILKICFTLVILLSIVFTVLTLFGKIPDIEAVTGEKLPSEAVTSLLESGIIKEGEKIQYYYSEDLFSFVDNGDLFTNSRVIAFETNPDTNDRKIYSAVYSEISDIKFIKSESTLEFSEIEIHVKNRPTFRLYVSTEEGGDQLFYKKLIEIWNANRETNNDGKNI